MNNSQNIMPNDVVRHDRTDDELVVCGVNHKTGEFVPCGWPFPRVEKLDEYVLVEKRYDKEPQTWDQILALKRTGYHTFIDMASDMYLMMERNDRVRQSGA